MTDKKLDDKLIKAFDSVRADSSVKARIKKGLTGDSMERKNITAAEDHTNKYVTEEKERAAVKRTGRITAAAVAAVVAIGGGAYMLKDAPFKTDKKRGADESQACYVGEVPDNFDGFFDPDGYTVYDKFGKDADIWRLGSGNFLVRQVEGEGAEYYQYDGQEFRYLLYDGSSNSVLKEVKTDGAGIYVYDECFVTWKTDRSDPDEYGVSENTTLTCTVYDLDMETVRGNVELKLENEELCGAPVVGADGKLFCAGLAYDQKTQMYTLGIRDENGEKISSYDTAGTFLTVTGAGSGKYMYFFRDDEDGGSKLYIKGLADGYNDMEIPVEKENTMVYSVGDVVYMVCPDENDRLTVTSISVTGGEQKTVGYDAGFSFTSSNGFYGKNMDHCCVSENGRYMFMIAMKPGEEEKGCELYVYDLEDTSAEVREFPIDKLYADTSADRCNILVDEASGDVCIGGFYDISMVPSPRQSKTICFNLYTDDYTNFGIKAYEADTDENDLATETNIEPPVYQPTYGFSPEGGNIFDKFNSAAEIYRITDSRYVIENGVDNNGENGYEYVIYDAVTNSVVNGFITEQNICVPIENGFVTLFGYGGSGASQSVTASVYNEDGDCCDRFSFTTGLAGPDDGGIADFAFAPDGSAMYVAVLEYGDSEVTKLYKVMPEGSDKTAGMNGEGWQGRRIYDMKVTADGSTICYMYSEDDENVKLGLISTSGTSEQVDDVAVHSGIGEFMLTERSNDIFFMNSYSGELTVLMSCETAAGGGTSRRRDGTLVKSDVIVGNAEYFTQNYEMPKYDDYEGFYISENGKYMLHTDSANGKIIVERIGGDSFNEAAEMQVGNGSEDILIDPDGKNTFFDEETGDVCLLMWDGSDMKSVGLNMFGEDYGNFGWYSSSGTSAETSESESGAVPDVAGMTEDEADDAFKKAGFNNVVLRRNYDNETEAGHVISTMPAAGQHAAAEDEITVYVSMGRLMTSGFNADGKTIYEKFDPDAQIHKINDNRYLIENCIEETNVDRYEYSLYDADSDSVLNTYVYGSSECIMLDNGFALLEYNNADLSDAQVTCYDENGGLTAEYSVKSPDGSDYKGGVTALAAAGDASAVYFAGTVDADGSAAEKIFRCDKNGVTEVNSEGWKDRYIKDITVSDDGSSIAYLYTDDTEETVKLGMLITASGRYTDDVVTVTPNSPETDRIDLVRRNDSFYVIDHSGRKISVVSPDGDGWAVNELSADVNGNTCRIQISESGKYAVTEEQSVKDEYLYTAYSLDGGSISRVNSVLYKEDAAADGRNVEYRKADIEAAFDEDTGAYSMVRGVFELDETGAVKSEGYSLITLGLFDGTADVSMYGQQ